MPPSYSKSIGVFHQSMIEAEYGKPAELFHLKRDIVVFLLLDMYGAATRPGIKHLCRPANEHGGVSYALYIIILCLARRATILLPFWGPDFG